MSVVAAPLNLPNFSESELFTSSGAASAHAELPPSLPSAAPRNLVPFPMFQQRHSSPYPMPQSFSALGPPNLGTSPLSGAPVPPAPKQPPIGLPVIAPDGTEVHAQSPLPPTPDPSPPNSKVLFPTAMVKLAPPADDTPYSVETASAQVAIHDGTPRRMPIISIDKIATESPTTGESSGLSRMRAHSSSSLSGSTSARPKSMGPPARPVRRSQTAIHPTSIRMSQSSSADSRSRLRSGAASRQSTANILNSRNGSPGLPRTYTDSAVTPPRNHGIEASTPADAPDLGGPDGLEAKVVLLGSQGVGKTSLILRYTTRVFSTSPAAATIGSSLHTRKLVHSGVRVKLQIWDTAGQERFRSMAPIYYRGAHVCVLVYDISDRQSFQDVRSWLEELARTVPKETVIYVVGAKIDLESRRVVSIEEARRTVRFWLRPPPPVPTPLLSPPTNKGLFRSTSSATRLTDSDVPTRSHSSSALAALERPSQLVPSPIPSSNAISKSHTEESSSFSIPISTQPSGSGSSSSVSRPFPALKITPVSPTSPRSKRVSFPALQSPTKPTSATFTEPVSPSLMSSSPPSRHGMSGGRFSISGVLGYSHSNSMSGAVSNLTRLAEDFPASRVSLDRNSIDGPRADIPTRVRVESSPALAGPSIESQRRRSEDWSSRSWRMGEGPSAAEALGEFGDGVKRKQSGELLSPSAERSKAKPTGRVRGGSLGRDSRLYGDESTVSNSSDEGANGWGVDVEGVRIGECSALTGEGVEALFKSISSLLVERKDKIERERILRHKNSIMLTAPGTADKSAGASKDKESNGRYGCCT